MAGNLQQGVPKIPGGAQFSDFAPDVDPITPGVLLDMDNVYPTPRGYRSYPSLIRYSTAPLASQCFGAWSGKISTAQVTVAGTATNLYTLQNKTFVNTGIVSTLMAYPQRWRFDTYGQDLIAVNGINRPYVQSGPLGTWQPLGGTPPVASIVQATEFALFLIEPNSDIWHASLSDTIWGNNIATQTVQGNLYATSGNITAAVQLRRGIVLYKRKAFHYGSFAGPPLYWEFPPISHEIGAPCQEAVANVLDQHFWPGPDDFYSFDGQSLQRMPNNLKDWFFATLDQIRDNEICSRWDQKRSVIFWHFPSRAAPSNLLDSWIAYNLRTNRWSKGSLQIEFPIFATAQISALTYGDFTAKYTTYSAIPAGLKYADLRDQNNDLTGAFSPDHYLGLFNGSPLPAYVTTHDFGDRHNKYLVTRVQPQFTFYPAQGAQLDIYAQALPGTDPMLVKTATLTPNGWFDALNTARLQRFKMTLQSEAEITGVQADPEYAGER